MDIPVVSEHPFLPVSGKTDVSTAVKPKSKAPLPRENKSKNHTYGSAAKRGNEQRKKVNNYSV
jgi:hypothetical protein